MASDNEEWRDRPLSELFSQAVRDAEAIENNPPRPGDEEGMVRLWGERGVESNLVTNLI